MWQAKDFSHQSFMPCSWKLLRFPLISPWEPTFIQIFCWMIFFTTLYHHFSFSRAKWITEALTAGGAGVTRPHVWLLSTVDGRAYWGVCILTDVHHNHKQVTKSGLQVILWLLVCCNLWLRKRLSNISMPLGPAVCRYVMPASILPHAPYLVLSVDVRMWWGGEHEWLDHRASISRQWKADTEIGCT